MNTQANYVSYLAKQAMLSEQVSPERSGLNSKNSTQQTSLIGELNQKFSNPNSRQKPQIQEATQAPHHRKANSFTVSGINAGNTQKRTSSQKSNFEGQRKSSQKQALMN